MVLCMNHKMSGQITGEILEVSGFAVVVPEKALEAMRIVERQEGNRLSANGSLRQEQRFGLINTLYRNDYNPGITPSINMPGSPPASG